MDILEMYKRLSKEDKGNLTIYCIYDSIYSIAESNNVEIDDEVVKKIQEEAYQLYLDDEFFNFSETKISDFLTKCYIEDNSFLEKIKNIDYSDILNAIEDNDHGFYKDNEMER